MAKKSKSREKTSQTKASAENVKQRNEEDDGEEEIAPKKAAVAAAEEKEKDMVPREESGDSDDSSSSSGEDEDLVLEGVIVRNREVSDSDDTSSEEEEDDDDDAEETEEKADKKKRPRPKNNKEDVKTNDNKKSKSSPSAANTNKTGNKKQHQKDNEEEVDDDDNDQLASASASPSQPEIVQVEFTFCDMNEKYFHGLKTLLTSSSPIYASQSSGLADLMIENISVGTVVSTEGDVDGTVFGFASVLNVTTYQDKECIQVLKKLCLDKCPSNHKMELETVLSGTTKRPAGFFFQGRMVNMPLEIVEVMHQQLVLDMDWAVDNAEGGEMKRKSLDFGAFVRIAPTYRLSGGTSSSSATGYKYFDDEILEQHSEFSYAIELPKTLGMEETPHCTVIVLTKTGHRAAMKDISQMISGSGGGSR